MRRTHPACLGLDFSPIILTNVQTVDVPSFLFHKPIQLLNMLELIDVVADTDTKRRQPVRTNREDVRRHPFRARCAFDGYTAGYEDLNRFESFSVEERLGDVCRDWENGRESELGGMETRRERVQSRCLDL